MLARTGLRRAMKVAASTGATGMARMAASNTTITGITTATAITIAGTTNRIDSFHFAVAASSPTLAATAILFLALRAGSLR